MPPTQLIHRSLLVQNPAGLTCLDAVSWPAGTGTAFRAFFANGTGSDSFAAGLPGAATLTELRDLAGGLMVAGYQAGQGQPLILPFATGAAMVAMAPAETALFAGLNAAILLRTHETAATICDWLVWHQRTQALQGAVIVNRLPQGDLAAALAPLVADLGLQLVVLYCEIGRASCRERV